MARINSIHEFPKEIDRNHFGSWLSGFTDGEGCFRLCITPRKFRGLRSCPAYTAEFCIGQRADDFAILELIQSYLGCGKLYIDRQNYAKFAAAPKGVFRVVNPVDLITRIVPHFGKFPLLAKKKRDFAIWKEGVSVLYEVFRKPQRTGFMGRGRVPKWDGPEAEHFAYLHQELRKQRQYEAPDFLENPIPKTEKLLFEEN